MLSMNFYCNTKDVGPPLQYNLLIPVNISPVKKSYSLTDTIWITTDVQGKYFFDIKSNKNVLIDTGHITFSVGYNEFGSNIANPPNGFCDVITSNGVNTNRQLSQWGSGGTIENYGCGQPNYTCRIGFKPNEKGTYWIILQKDVELGSCDNKISPYNAEITYKFEGTDLGLDVFNGLSKNDKGGNDGIKGVTQEINDGKIFIFKVE